MEQDPKDNIIQILKNSVSRKDFDEVFKAIAQALQKLEQKFSESNNSMVSSHSATLSDLKKEVTTLFVEDKIKILEKRVDEKIRVVDEKIRNVRDGKDGVDGKDGKDGQRGPIGLQGKSENLTEIRDDLKAIKEEIKKLKSRPLYVSGGGGMSRDHFADIDISASFDGVTKTFNIQAVWKIITVDLSSYPYGSLRKNIDYTWTPTSITFTSEIDAETQLALGQKCIITAVLA